MDCPRCGVFVLDSTSYEKEKYNFCFTCGEILKSVCNDCDKKHWVGFKKCLNKVQEELDLEVNKVSKYLITVSISAIILWLSGLIILYFYGIDSTIPRYFIFGFMLVTVSIFPAWIFEERRKNNVKDDFFKEYKWACPLME